MAMRVGLRQHTLGSEAKWDASYNGNVGNDLHNSIVCKHKFTSFPIHPLPLRLSRLSSSMPALTHCMNTKVSSSFNLHVVKVFLCMFVYSPLYRITYSLDQNLDAQAYIKADAPVCLH
jgi:hypothetical protein